MEDLKNISIEPIVSSQYMKPYRMNYTQNGVKKLWDFGISRKSVCIIIFNVTRKKVIMVKQLRPAVLFAELREKYTECLDKDHEKVNSFMKGLDEKIGAVGITLELCAGIVDKDKSIAEIAREEVEEECGYKVKIDEMKFVQNFRASIGTGGAKMAMFYVEVTDEQKVSSGGGLASEGEMIEVVELSIEDVISYINSEDCQSPVFTLYGLQWFLTNKKEHL